MVFRKLRQSFNVLATSTTVRRLLKEDLGVKGVCWFAKYPEDRWHVAANILRVLCKLIFAPIQIYIVVNALVTDSDLNTDSNSEKNNNKSGPSWDVEVASIPDSILYNPNGSPGSYEVTGRRPNWLLKVTFKTGQQPTFAQVEWSEPIRDSGYTAISYPMDSAYELFREADLDLQDPMSPVAPKWSLRDRKAISAQLLFEYGKARERMHGGDGEEYIWLDEFCLSSEAEQDEAQVNSQRSHEVGQLADIFKNAKQVAVFCHVIGCDHTSVDCLWGTRVFTIGEILHATDVIRLTRVQGADGKPITEFHHETARSFRGEMQTHAAENQQWHLYAIMQHASNSGAVSWQTAIHSLVVEVIRRDEAGGFASHKFLGKVLNGLLPRRARLDDLKGKDGWADIAWLLELNQGFYNAASLASVCKTAGRDVPNHRWLGQPILPNAGNERLEPVVHAFPVRNEHQDGLVDSALCVVSPKAVLLSDKLIRDRYGFYTNDEMFPLFVFSVIIVALLILVAIALLGTQNIVSGVILAYATCSAYAFLELLVGTIYIKREGWVYLEDPTWGQDPQLRLRKSDPGYEEPLISWGNRQLAPTWDDSHLHPHSTSKSSPPNSTLIHLRSPSTDTLLPLRSASLVDLENRVVVRVVVTEKPNSLITMAIHGSGVTCLLLDRDEQDPFKVADKVGITNLPPFILSQGRRAGTVCVGGGAVKSAPKRKRIRDMVKSKEWA